MNVGFSVYLMIQSLESHNLDKTNGPSSMYILSTQVFLILPFHLLESQWCSYSDSYLVKVTGYRLSHE